MFKPTVNTVINYSSLDNSFIKKVIEESQKFSEVVLVSSFDRLFNGEVDTDLYELTDPKNNTHHEINIYDKNYSARFHHNLARWKGYHGAKSISESTHTLFLDSDEVPDGEKIQKLVNLEVQEDDSYKLANYWYYRDTCYQAYQTGDSATLVSRKSIHFDNFFTSMERDSIVDRWKYRYLTYEGEPTIHHYSWAKPKEQLYKKIKTWAHKNDMNWKGMLDKEFSGRFNYTCTFNGYHFKKVEPFVNFTFGQE